MVRGAVVALRVCGARACRGVTNGWFSTLEGLVADGRGPPPPDTRVFVREFQAEVRASAEFRPRSGVSCSSEAPAAQGLDGGHPKTLSLGFTCWRIWQE